MMLTATSINIITHCESQSIASRSALELVSPRLADSSSASLGAAFVKELVTNTFELPPNAPSPELLVGTIVPKRPPEGLERFWKVLLTGPPNKPFLHTVSN
jgi:hypothetical protein